MTYWLCMQKHNVPKWMGAHLCISILTVVFVSITACTVDSLTGLLLVHSIHLTYTSSAELERWLLILRNEAQGCDYWEMAVWADINCYDRHRSERIPVNEIDLLCKRLQTGKPYRYLHVRNSFTMDEAVFALGCKSHHVIYVRQSYYNCLSGRVQVSPLRLSLYSLLDYRIVEHIQTVIEVWLRKEKSQHSGAIEAIESKCGPVTESKAERWEQGRDSSLGEVKSATDKLAHLTADDAERHSPVILVVIQERCLSRCRGHEGHSRT